MKKMRQSLSLLLLLVCFQAMDLSARGYAQEPRLTVSLKDVPLAKVFEVIRQKTDYQFLYNDDVLAGAPLVSVHLKNALVSEILETCFRSAHLRYKIDDKTILVMAPETKSAVPDATAGQHPAIEVHGVVQDEKGAPIEGVSVVVRGGLKGTTTDGAGRFSLTVGSEDDIIVFSYIGFQTFERRLGNAHELNIVLKARDASMNDVVVVGYGVQRKATLTGAVSAIDNKELVTTKNENIVNVMTGKIPGLRVQQMSAEPGSYNNTYDIRGLGTPLIIIDGVPRTAADLSRMDPSEIDNISVLKDASAAIYGVKAANGAILVTTRHGARNAAGKFTINYSFNQSWQQFLDVPQGVDAVTYMKLYNEEQRTNFATNFINNVPPTYSDSDIALYTSGKLQSTNWVKAITRPFAPETQHNLNVTGGNDKVNYFFDLGYFSQGSLFKTNSINYDRWNVRSNVNVNITSRLRATTLLSAYTDTKNAPNWPVWEIFKYAENLLPTDQIYANDNPNYLHVEPDNSNPVAMTNSSLTGQNIYTNKNFQGQGALEYDIPGIRGLMARGMFNYGLSIADNTVVNKAFNLYNYDPQNNVYDATLVHSPSTVQRQYYSNINTLMQLSLNYKHTFSGVHNVSGLILYEEGHQTADNFSAQRNFSLGIPYLFAGDNNSQQIASQDANGATDFYDIVTKSIVGRYNYDFKGRYLAEFTFREDASSRFSPTARWGFFPAFLAGWRVSEEPFMRQLIAPSILTNLKIRGSYGKTGDDAPVQYQWVPGYSYPAAGAILGGSYVNGLVSRGVTNPDLTWLKSDAFNAGLDWDLWNGLIGGSFDYFIRNENGLLATIAAQLPGSAGEALPQQNLNGTQTRGFEVLLTHHKTIRRVNYSVSGNVSVTRTKNTAFEQTRAGNSYENYVNSQADRYTNIWWGYQYGGVFNSYGQIYNYGVNTGGGNQSLLPGDTYEQDLNHDGVIDAKDQVPLATRDIPIINYGLTLSANWKGFDLSVLLQGAFNFHVQYAEQLATPLMYGRSALTQFTDRWHPADPNANEFDPNTVWVPGTFPVTGSQAPLAQNDSRAVQNASYMRIKTLEIGYSLPRRLLTKVGIQNFRVYVNSYNLATITGLKNADPEHPGVVSATQDWNISQGGYLYPENRTFSLGASVSF